MGRFTGKVALTTSFPAPGDEDWPIKRNLGTVRSYAPGSPQEIDRLVAGLEDVIRRLREDAAQIDSALRTASETRWEGQWATRFRTTVGAVPPLVRGRLIPVLEATVARMRAYRNRLVALQQSAEQQIANGQAHENARIDVKQSKDNTLSVPELTGTVVAKANTLKAKMRAENSQVNKALQELESLRAEKRSRDLVLAQDLDDASVQARQMTAAVVEAVDAPGVGDLGSVVTPVGAGVGSGPAYDAGLVADDQPPVDVAPVEQRAPGGSRERTPDTGAVDAAPVGAGGSGAVVGAPTPSGPVTGDGLVTPKRLDPRFPVGMGTDLSGNGLGDDGPGTALAAAGVVGALAVGGAALAARRSTGSDEEPGDEDLAAEPIASTKPATRDTTSRGGAPHETAEGGVGLALPVAVVAASAVVGLLVAAFGGGWRGSIPQRAAERLGGTWDRSGRRLLGRRVVEQLSEDSARRSTEEDGARPEAPVEVVLPGGLTAEVPGSWTVARDEHCAVLTPGPSGSFAANLVVVLDPAMPTDALAGVEDLPAGVVLDHDLVSAAVSGNRARFGYAAGGAPLTVHRYAVRTAEGTVVLTASVATTRVDEDAPMLDRILASVRPAA